MQEKEIKLRELVKWFISDTNFQVSENEVNMLLSYYRNVDENETISDFAYMHGDFDKFRKKLDEIKNYNINSLIKWFVSDTASKLNVTSSDIEILKFYYKNNRYVTEDKMVEDFSYMHDSSDNFSNKIAVISKELIDVESLNGEKYIKLIYGNGSFKVYENPFLENVNLVFDKCVSSGRSVSDFFDNALKDKVPLTSDEISSILEVSDKGGISNQKTLGSHPGTGNFSWVEEGFMNVLFFIFLTGVSIGVILMIVFNIFR